MTTFIGLRAKSCSYIIDVDSAGKKQKTQKKGHKKKT